MLVAVKTLTGGSILLDVDPASTVEDVKQVLHQKLEWAADVPSILILEGKVLDNSHKLETYKPQNHTCFHFVKVVKVTSTLASATSCLSETESICHDKACQTGK